MSITLFSPAKLNLFFRVLKKREDGFHEIASLYQAISLGDILEVGISKEDLFFCNDPSLPFDRSNLVLKALDLFRAKTGIKEKLRISLTKNTPVQRGLGGGSSNAATTLWALAELFKGAVTFGDLLSWSALLGSDVPFFFSSGTAYCTGRGEKIENIASLKKKTLWIASPKEGLSTPSVYKACNPSTFLSREPLDVLASFQEEDPAYFNDLEASAFSLMPSLKNFKAQLFDLGFETACMTGSGSAFFCFGDVSYPSLENTHFYPVEYVQRKEGSWFELPTSVLIHN